MVLLFKSSTSNSLLFRGASSLSKAFGLLSILLILSIGLQAQTTRQITNKTQRGDYLTEKTVQQDIDQTRVKHTTPSLPVLSEQSLNAKTLFQKTHQLDLSEHEFRKFMDTTAANLQKWEDVLANYKGDTSTDLSFIQGIVDGMKQKLTLMD